MNEPLEKKVDPPKIGSWRGGILLARASWSALKLDKELALFPIFSAISSFVLLCLVGLVLLATGLVKVSEFSSDAGPALLTHWTGYIVLFVCYVLVAISTNFFAASIISAALHRFAGGDPNIQYGMDQAKRRFGSIVQFSFLSATVGLVLRILEDRASWTSRITAALFGLVWSLATIFAIPVIVTSEEPIDPFRAIKKSTEIFVKVWAKNAVGNLGMGLVIMLFFLLWLALSVALILGCLFIQPVLLFVGVPISVIALVLLISFSSALSSIFQAALYHYAISGESPVQFEKELLQAAFKPKGKMFA